MISGHALKLCSQLVVTVTSFVYLDADYSAQLSFIAMADKEHRDTDNPSLNPEQLVWIDNIISAARPQQAMALALACRMFTHPHQFQRCSFYSLLRHNQVRGGRGCSLG